MITTIKKPMQVFLLLFLLLPAVSMAQMPRQFDAKRVAALEVSAWKAYYKHETFYLMKSLVLLLREQFQLSYPQAILTVYHGGNAARIFSNIKINAPLKEYQRKVIPELEAFYARLKRVVGSQWSVPQVAKAELAWWVARRQPGQNHYRKVGVKIATLYSLLYNTHNRHIVNAGILRAKAAAMRDRQSRRGRIDWLAIEKLLQRSYQTLLRGL